MENINETKSSEISDKINNNPIDELKNENKYDIKEKEQDKKENKNFSKIEELNTNKDEIKNISNEENNEQISNQKEEINSEVEKDSEKKDEANEKGNNIIEPKDEDKKINKEKEKEVDVDKNLEDITEKKEEKININENKIEKEKLTIEANISEETLIDKNNPDNIEQNINKEVSNKDSFNNNQIESQVDYNYIYFIIKYKKEKDLSVSFLQDNLEATVENIKKITNPFAKGFKIIFVYIF